MEDGEEKEHFSLKKIIEREKERSLRGKKKRKRRSEAQVSDHTHLAAQLLHVSPPGPNP